MTIKEKKFTNSNQLAGQLATKVANILNKELQVEGRALLAVSGGSTPKLFFQKLSQKDIDWARVFITLVDERWVPNTDTRSNAKLVQENLLINRSASASFFSLYTNDKTPLEGIEKLTNKYHDLQLKLTAVILGMGTDGHTASFFPRGSHLDQALDLENKNVFSPMYAPGANESRMTFTLSEILKTSWLALHIEGEEKKKVLEKAYKNESFATLPICSVLHQDQTDLYIFWCP